MLLLEVIGMKRSKNNIGGDSMKKELVIITGISGSGKNTALNVFEDFGYFCVDNMPSLLVNSFLKLLEDKDIKKICYQYRY